MLDLRSSQQWLWTALCSSETMDFFIGLYNRRWYSSIFKMIICAHFHAKGSGICLLSHHNVQKSKTYFFKSTILLSTWKIQSRSSEILNRKSHNVNGILGISHYFFLARRYKVMLSDFPGWNHISEELFLPHQQNRACRKHFNTWTCEWADIKVTGYGPDDHSSICGGSNKISIWHTAQAFLSNEQDRLCPTSSVSM